MKKVTYAILIAIGDGVVYITDIIFLIFLYK